MASARVTDNLAPSTDPYYGPQYFKTADILIVTPSMDKLIKSPRLFIAQNVLK